MTNTLSNKVEDTQELADELETMLLPWKQLHEGEQDVEAGELETEINAWFWGNTDRILSALRTTHSPSEAEVEAFKRVIHDECRNHAEATVVAGSFSQGYATAWEDAARILPDRLAALSLPSDKTVELLREADGHLKQLADISGNLPWVAEITDLRARIDSHLGEMK